MGLKGLLLLLVLMMSSMSIAQVYSDDKEKFVKEFQKALSEHGRGEIYDFAKKELPGLLLGNSSFSNSNFSKMVEMCNQMHLKKRKTYPDIYNYVYAVSAFAKSNQTAESYNAWHSSVDKLLSGRNVKKFSEFLEMSEALFSESCIAESSSFSWYYVGGSFEFEYDKKAFINFEGGNLVCRVISNKSRSNLEVIDSLNVINTSGRYDPKLRKWIGSGGKITWEKAGLNPDKTFALITSYGLSLKNSKLRIDSVNIRTPYFNEMIGGMMTDRAFKVNREEDKIYPQFLSFKHNLLVENIIPNMDYIGGFSMRGDDFIGMGSASEKAQIILKKNNTAFITAKAKEIRIKPDKIAINKAAISMYFNSGDSLYHPGLNFNYDLKKKRIEFARTASGIGQAPFEDSYHQLEIYAPRVTWNVADTAVYFTYEPGISQEQKTASFQSKAYYDAQLYSQLQVQSSVNPLVALSKHCYLHDEYVITEGAAASVLGMTVSQAKLTLYRLSSMGFVVYDSEGKTVTITDKLETFVKANAGRIDYDNIVFTSDLRPKTLKGYSKDRVDNDPYLQSLKSLYETQNKERRIKKNFGVLSLTTLDLDLEAVDRVVLSASNNTVVFPANNTVRIKRDRNFDFSGWVNAGKLEVNTKEASFEYKAFKLNLLSTEGSFFKVRPLKQEDGQRSIAMVSSLVGISGELLIDASENKSGHRAGYESYPQLKSKTSSKVFYNSKVIHGGIYDSARFYYTVLPFELDSLNSFNEKAFKLKGALISAGIFPKINEDLKIMPDYSFGFSVVAPSGGYKFYGTEANYEHQVALSGNGLQGLGVIDFVHSRSISKQLSFLPDSTIGVAQFVNRPVSTGVEFPHVTATDAYITYIPKKHILKVKSSPNNDLVFFDQDARLKGVATVQVDGIMGSGEMTFVNASLISDNFNYNHYDIGAASARFNLKNDSVNVDEPPLAFKANNVNAYISIQDRKGVFKSSEGRSVVEFPVNQYGCEVDEFTWLIDDASIEMQQAEKQSALGSDRVATNFFSTPLGEHSLRFRAPEAKFDLKTKTISCNKVRYVDVADARIYPDSLKLTIRKNAKLDQLVNAELVAGYHQFFEATVDVKTGRDYVASGQYLYYDLDSTVTFIAMADIGLDSSYQTTASGEITLDTGFKLNNKFDYYGGVRVYASNPLILFSGATRLNHSCSKFDRNWMAFTSEINPKNIQIPVFDEMNDLEGNAISAGIVWRDSPATDSIVLYPTFLSALIDQEDPIVMTSTGYLQYDYGSNEFQIGSKEKLINRSGKGNYLALHTGTCSLSGDGVVSLGMDYGSVGVDAVGTVSYDQQTGETSMDVTARFDMELDKRLMQKVAAKINAIEGLHPMDFNSTTLEQAIITWNGQQAADKVKDEYARLGTLKRVPDGINKSMTITGLHLSSFDNQKLQDKGLITNAGSAVLVNFYGEPVMKYIPFKAFFQQIYSRSGGDAFTTLMRIPGGHDYLFHYSMDKKNGTLKILTGDKELSTSLMEMKEDKRKKKNFMFEATDNTAYLAKFMNLFK